MRLLQKKEKESLTRSRCMVKSRNREREEKELAPKYAAVYVRTVELSFHLI